MGTFAPSRYQQKIFDTVDEAFEKQQLINLIISAVAGSGKSTTLRELLAHIPPHLRVVFLTFGHDINEDQTNKVKAYLKECRRQKRACAKASCMTIHSLGATCLHRIEIHGNPERGKRKYNRLCQD
jgi:superfamily I DNA/RNA helicase